MAIEWSTLDRYSALSSTSDTQGDEENAKDDVLYYGEGGTYAQLATDLSQYADNQTVAAWGHYEPSPASRFNVTTSWTVEVVVEVDNTDTGRFFTYSNMSLRLSAGGAVEPILNGGVLTGITLPGIGAGAARYVIAWATELNLLTTGAGDALRTELRAWNTATGAYTQVTYTHAARTAGTADFIWWASSTGGANAFSNSPEACRFSAGRFRSATETAEDFVALTSAPTITGQSRIELVVPEPGSDLADASYFAGPVLASCAAAVSLADLRMLSPIVNESYLQRTTLSGSGLTGTPSQWKRIGPDQDYTLLGSHLFSRRVPARVDRLKVRVQLQQWRTSGVTADEVHVRVWSMNRPPQPVGNDVVDHDHALVLQTCHDSIATSHGSGASAGEWLDLGLLRVARNSRGRTWLVVALWIENLSGAVANNRVRLQAVTIEPVLAA
jgi:hypothetical protein